MLTKTITPTTLSTNIGAVSKWISEGYTLIVVNKRKNNLPLFKIEPISKVLKSNSNKTIDMQEELDSELITPPTLEQLKNPYETPDQNSKKHSQKPLYRFATSR
jgi:hypothetical protein